MSINRVPVTSGNIKSIGHDPKTNTLEVEFHDGGVYRYPGVDSEAHNALMGAESIGKTFAKNFRATGAPYTVVKKKKGRSR